MARALGLKSGWGVNLGGLGRFGFKQDGVKSGGSESIFEPPEKTGLYGSAIVFLGGWKRRV